MKTYNQLTKAEQAKARGLALNDLLQSIIEGGLRFDDAMNGNDLQGRIDTAMEKAERLQTPWFAHEHILDTCRDQLESLALCDAEDTVYMQAGERCRHLA